jgi:VWFA-related protein
MSRPAHSIVAGLALVSCVTALGHAQQPEPSFRVSSELVVIDLVVADRQGRFITDLRPEEVEVKEDGKRQQVQQLRLVGDGSGAMSATVAAATDVQPDRTAATPGSVDGPADGAVGGTVDEATPVSRRLAIVVDGLSLSVDAMPRVRASLLATIDDVPDDLPVLLATIGTALHVRQPFTTDKAALRTAIDALPPHLDTPAGVARVFDAVDRLCASAVDTRRVVDAAIEAGEQLVLDAHARSAATSEALAMLATRLGAFEGRKHLVLYSSGHAISPEIQAVDAVAAAVSACTDLDAMAVRRDASSALGRLTNRAASDGLRVVIDRANRAQITFYTLDPSGITTSTIMPSTRGTAQTGGQGPLANFAGLRADAGRDYVEGLADETGGLTVTSNDMAVVLRRAWEDAGQYYLVGYAPPPAKGRGDLRKITVSVKRAGVSVRYRKGYIAAPTAAAAPLISDADGAVDEALTNPARFASDDIVVTPTVQADTLSVEVLVRSSAITFSEVSGEYRADFVVHAALHDAAQPGTAIDIPGKALTLRLSRDDYLRLMSADNLRVLLTTEAPRSERRLTVVVRDARGWIAASETRCCSP